MEITNTNTEENTTASDWREDVGGEVLPKFKVLDGEAKTIKFLDNGEKRSHSDYGDSIVFKVFFELEEHVWYVKANNFSLLGQIKDLAADLVGVSAVVKRTGSQKSDTRYTISGVSAAESAPLA